MLNNRSARLAWLLWVVLLLYYGVGLSFQWLNDPSRFWGQLYAGFALFVFAAVGALILSRQPSNRMAWVLIAGTGAILSFTAGQYATYALITSPGRFPGGIWAGWLGQWVGTPGFLLLFTFTLLLFPNGQLLSPRWKPIAWVIVGFIVLKTVISALIPGPLFDPPLPVENPFGLAVLAGFAPAWQRVTDFMVLPIIGVCILATLLRFSRARGEERQQLKWFAYGTACLVVLIPLISFVQLPEPLQMAGFPLVVSILPITLGIAIFKYRLYDIDLIIRRTLVYTVLTVLLALVYLSSVILLQRVFRGWTGQGSDLAIIISTLAIAALFVPLRNRVQRAIDHRFYRRKYNAGQVLATFAATMRDEVDLGRLTDELQTVVEETMQPEHVSVWLKKTDTRKGRSEA